MGQRISILFAKGNFDVPDSIVHFDYYDSTIIVLDLDEWDITGMIEAAMNYEQFSLFLNHLKETDLMVSDDEGGYYRQDDWVLMIDLIESLAIKTWYVEFYSEWADMIANNLFMGVIDDNIIKESCVHMWNEQDTNQRNISVTKAKMSLTFNWVADEKRYFNYARSQAYYLGTKAD